MHRIVFLIGLTLSLAACEGTPFNDDLTSQAFIANRMNFGEASDRNLRMMVANKRDLYTPRRETPADSTRRDNVISAYRLKTTATQNNQ
jgi:type IV pilus biogenesis protein CpaD/CtpE